MKMQLALFLSVYSDSELFNVKWTIFHLYLDESRLLFDEMMRKSLLYKFHIEIFFVQDQHIKLYFYSALS
jgi:hypothetical protein